LAQGCLEVLTANVEEAVVRLILEAQQPTQSFGCFRTLWLDLLNESGGLLMILTARAASKRSTTRRIRSSDSCQDGESAGGAGIFHVPGFASGHLGDFEEFPAMSEASTCLCH
jgi:hypothetical protein